MFVLDNHLTTTQNVDVDEDLKEKLRNSVEIKSFVFVFVFGLNTAANITVF
jgi:hypothetical protein